MRGRGVVRRGGQGAPRLVRVALLGLAVAGCTERIPPPSAPAPSFERPSSVIPGDLDLVVRVDRVALGRFLGPAARDSFALTLTDPAADPAVAVYVAQAFERADVLWIALRPSRRVLRTDNVVVLRGRFAGLEPPRAATGTPGGFGPPADLGNAFRVYERPKPADRAAPSRIYARADDWLVLVSEAEIDSVERSIEKRAGDPHLDPADRGLASAALRPRPLRELFGAALSELEILVDASLVEIVAEGAPEGLRVEVVATFPGPELAAAPAGQVRAIVERLRSAEGFLGRIAASARVEELGVAVSVRFVVETRDLALLVECAASPRGC